MSFRISRTGVSVALAGILIVFVYFFRTPLSWIVWERMHAASIAVELNGTDPELFFSIGNYYFGDGAYDIGRAESYFYAALRLNPSLEGLHYQLARVAFIRGNFYGAEMEINKELELYPDFGRSHYVRGLIYGYSGQLAKAEIEFKDFLKWKPESWAGNNDLAWIYFQEGKYEDARDAALSGLKVAPDNPWLLNSLGVALLNTNDKKGAKEAFTKALAVLNTLGEEAWGRAYPGNDPGLYAKGYSQMKSSLEANLQLLGVGDTAHSG